ncbi:MAG: metallophosphoesterase [Tannerella sp.]|jgi:3',5'-cyclic AMP phosphodiesterase CpdA|nr:metallophosphoesterase [Tannerella sp.]
MNHIEHMYSGQESGETRRSFLRKASLLGIGGLAGTIGGQATASTRKAGKKFKPIKFGIIADLHLGLAPDAGERLDAFLKKVRDEKPDFIISLGDFIHDLHAPEYQECARRFKNVACPAYHVLGNHEHDSNTKKEAADFLKMPAPYYSCDVGEYHCVVLDGNYIYSDNQFTGYEKGDYFNFGDKTGYINDEQCEWLMADLKATPLPTFLFSHQSLLHDNGIPNKAYIKRILEQENERAGFNKVLACFNGHMHQDFYGCINNIHYFSINSASYFWHNEKIPGRYPDLHAELCESCLDSMAIYKDPLFCFVEVSASGHLSLNGMMSEWIAAIPEAIVSDSVRYGREMLPYIADRRVVLK